MDEKEELFLCRPCAERIKAFQTVREVGNLRHRRDKGTCEQCGLRRFGYLCDVEFRPLPETGKGRRR